MYSTVADTRGAMGRSSPPWAVFFNFYIINYNIGLELTESRYFICENPPLGDF